MELLLGDRTTVFQDLSENSPILQWRVELLLGDRTTVFQDLSENSPPLQWGDVNADVCTVP